MTLGHILPESVRHAVAARRVPQILSSITRYAEHDNDMLARETEGLESLSSRYDSQIVPLDTKIKRAYREGTVEEWEAALNEAERLMRAK